MKSSLLLVAFLAACGSGNDEPESVVTAPATNQPSNCNMINLGWIDPASPQGDRKLTVGTDPCNPKKG